MPCPHGSYLPLLNSVFNFVQIAIQGMAVSDTDACGESEFVRSLKDVRNAADCLNRL
jgi:hypothetical protein